MLERTCSRTSSLTEAESGSSGDLELDSPCALWASSSSRLTLPFFFLGLQGAMMSPSLDNTLRDFQPTRMLSLF